MERRTTQTMNSGVMSMTMGATPVRRSAPSLAAEATASLRIAERLRAEGRADDYRAAITQHFTSFGGSRSASCPLQ